MSRHLRIEASKRTPHYWIALPAQLPDACRLCIVELAWAAFVLYQRQELAAPLALCQQLAVEGLPQG